MTPGPTLRVVNDALACRLLDMDRAYEAVQGAYRQAATQPPVLSTPSAQLMRHPTAPPVAMKVKGAQLPEQRVAGFRIVADHHADAGQAEVSHDWQWVLDLDTGQPIGLVAMNTLHAVRTALTGLVALEALRGPRCQTVAVVGAGTIAGWLVTLLRDRLRASEIRVVASRPHRAEAFAARHGAPVIAAPSVDAAVTGADAVIAISSAAQPVLHGHHLGRGVTLIGMGGSHECDASVLAAADRFIVDDLDFATVSGSLGAWVRGGGVDAATARSRLDGLLGDVITGGVAGRQHADERVFAIVQGMACCDLAIAADILARAALSGEGAVLPL